MVEIRHFPFFNWVISPNKQLTEYLPASRETEDTAIISPLYLHVVYLLACLLFAVFSLNETLTPVGNKIQFDICGDLDHYSEIPI